jgi:sugar phosphate isomerase/epimerase
LANQQESHQRPRLSISELTTYRWTFDEDVYHYREVGISALGVWRQKLADFGEDKGRELLADSEMDVSSLCWAGGFTGSDGRNQRESLADAREAIELAAFLEASCLLVYTGPRGGHTSNHADRLFRSALDELVPIAEQHGVTLAIEPMHPRCATDWTFLTDLEQALQWLQGYDQECLRLALDIYQWGFDPMLGEMLEALVPYLGLVQLGDGRLPPDREQSRCPLGAGEIPLADYVGRLTTLGYAGYYELELMGEEIESLDYEQMLHECKQVYDLLTVPTVS